MQMIFFCITPFPQTRTFHTCNQMPIEYRTINCNHMLLNPFKCKFMPISRKRNRMNNPLLRLSMDKYWKVSLYIYRIVPCKRTPPSNGPHPNFDSSVVCEVLRVTAHHAKLLRGDSKLHSLSSSRLFR